MLGLLPGLDNFSHIGGFLMGLALGVCLLHSPNALRQRIGQPGRDEPPYEPVINATTMSGAARGPGRDGGGSRTVAAWVRKPVGFFRGRKAFWWVWWLFRAGALLGVLIAFIVLLNNFYKYRTQCRWCKYLSCLVGSFFLFSCLFHVLFPPIYLSLMTETFAPVSLFFPPSFLLLSRSFDSPRPPLSLSLSVYLKTFFPPFEKKEGKSKKYPD